MKDAHTCQENRSRKVKRPFEKKEGGVKENNDNGKKLFVPFRIFAFVVIQKCRYISKKAYIALMDLLCEMMKHVA